MAIIYDGKVLVAHHNPGETPYLLVTFIGLDREHLADSVYLMRALVEREAVDCIGITTRQRNFYIHDEIHEIAALVKQVRRPGQKVIVIGQSSAGLAAVKFADLMGADYVLAFSPIFSAHEADLGLTDDMQREIGFLRGAVRLHRIDPDVVRPGMHPGPDDCSAPLFVIFDPANESDAWAANCYADVIPQTRLMRCTDLGHAVFERIYEEQGHHLLAMLDRLAAGDQDGAFMRIHQLSRRSESAVTALLLRVARWRPNMVDRALRTDRARSVLTDRTRQRHQFNDIMVFEFVKRGQIAAALDHLRTLHPALFGEQEERTSLDGPGMFLVFSCHGDLLALESESMKIGMISQGLFSGTHVPVILDTRGESPCVLIQIRNGERPVVLDPASAATDGTDFEIVPVPGTDLRALRRGEAFLKADYQSTPIFASSRIQAWEWFALIPISRPEVFANRSAMNWFDQVVLEADEQTVTQKAVPARRTAFRSILQRYFN